MNTWEWSVYAYTYRIRIHFVPILASFFSLPATSCCSVLATFWRILASNHHTLKKHYPPSLFFAFLFSLSLFNNNNDNHFHLLLPLKTHPFYRSCYFSLSLSTICFLSFFVATKTICSIFIETEGKRLLKVSALDLRELRLFEAMETPHVSWSFTWDESFLLSSSLTLLSLSCSYSCSSSSTTLLGNFQLKYYLWKRVSDFW